ncbi:MAG TPA: penicillin-binding transpeptidase domain-containing protein, partial [Nannocystaceae bacterium]|nr:penicillin-binding transpeptidase domain-containing protein [Nannocystaceae bacterium]
MPTPQLSRAALAVVTLVLGCDRPAATSAAPTTPSTAAPTDASSEPAALPEVALDHPGCFEIVALDGPAGAEPRRHEASAGECAVPTIPASTFKIPHALVALQTGVVADPDAMVKWDGAKYWLKSWERDHSLRTAIEESVVWFFQRTAEQIGRERMREQLAKLDYGDAEVDGDIREFWLAGGSLEITCDEQLDFVVRMFRDELAIDATHVAIVQSIMKSDLARWQPRVPKDFTVPASTATVWAKTGTDAVDGKRITWWMGAIEGPKGRFAFVSRVRDE